MATPTRLTPRQRRSLTDDGYLLVRSLLAGADLARIAARLADHVRQTVAAWAEEPSLDTHGGCVMTRFALDDPGLALCSEHPLVADAAATVLADGWRPQVLELRAPIPGCGAQGLHTDFGEPAQGLPTWRGLSAMWCISAFTRDNGPLRVIPGSHLVSEPPIDTEHGYATGMGPHPGEVKIIAPAGSLVLFNGPDLWHSGTFNYSPAARLAVTACFAPGPPWGLKDYSARVRGEQIGNVVLVTSNAAGRAQHIVANYRPRTTLPLLSRLIGEHFAGIPYGERFASSAPE
jgi:hypothetical protein